jgi:hypothetical protein
VASTTERGNDFRDAVCDLLRTKYPDAQVEQRINGTKVDILFTRTDDFGTSEKIAVECKDYAHPLTKSYITKNIYGQYEIMLSNDSIQRVMIVSRHPLGADAAAYIHGWKYVTHHTFDQLAEALLGLQSYIKYLAALKPTGGFDYIETRLQGLGGAAIDRVIEWVDSEGDPGLAILGGYGQGKTSFANRLAAHYANTHIKDPSARIPMLFRLGTVVHETQLEGLLGKEFTAVHRATGFQFSTFEHLNRAGRFLVILDGFDEMKHAMTAADFRANFKEFNRLLVGKAKVLLLGRPNALPSDERDLVFRGKKDVGGQSVLSAVYAPWVERRLAFFSADESRRLLHTTLERLISRNISTGRTDYPAEFLEARIEEVFEKVQEDLLVRPVHLLIIAELASDPNFDLSGFNEFRLYDHFIRTLVERDTSEKRARQAIDLESRLKFQRNLAWWAWRRVGSVQGHFFRHDVPVTLLSELPSGDAADEEGKRNEYIVSTLTEEKENGILFFAHRSFQEFLVADYVRVMPTTPATHVEYSAYLTPDIMSFLRQAPSVDFMLSWYDSLRSSSGPLESSYLDFYASFPELIGYIRSILQTEDRSEIDAWTVCILFKAYLSNTSGSFSKEEILVLLLATVKSGHRDAAATAALALLHLYSTTSSKEMIQQIAVALLERCLSRSKVQASGDTLMIQSEKRDFSISWLKSVNRIFPKKGSVDDALLGFRIRDFENASANELKAKGANEVPANPFGDIDSLVLDSVVSLPLVRVVRALNDELIEEFSHFLSRRQDKFSVVEISGRDKSRPGVRY